MMKLMLALILLWSGFCITSCQSDQNKKLLIATSANMQFTMEDIVEAFSAKTGIECDLIVSSSGILTAQIIEGAPYDVFVSADLKYPETLYQRGLGMEKPSIYAYGRLVLWTLNESIQPSLEILRSDKVKHIAIANPKTAPYGQAAMNILIKTDLYPEIKDKLVFGESISQTNQFIISTSADIGFTAISVVNSKNQQGQGRWEVMEYDLYDPIAQGILILKTRDEKYQNAKTFFEFLFSSSSRDILENYGYQTTLEMQ